MKASTLLPLPIVVLLMVAGACAAGPEPSRPRCAGCGCATFRKVCRLVCEMKEDIDYEYDVDHDDYCLPAVSQIRGKKWVPDCKSLLGWRKALIWKPRCDCKVHSRKTLVKIRVVKKVPTYNCVVDRVCCRCGKSEVDLKATEKVRQQGITPESAGMAVAFDDGEANSSDRMIASSQGLRR